MTRFEIVAVSVFCLSAAVTAQADRGAITGRLTDPDGGPIPTAVVQMKNTATGMVSQTTSGTDGSYSLSGLAAGTYDLTIPTIGFTFRRTERKGLVIAAGQTLRTDVRFEWGGNLGTPGDDFTFVVRSLHPVPSGPTPRTPDGKPDFSGVWLGLPASQEPASLLPWADALVKERQANSGRDHPSGFCLPGDVILNSPFLYKLIQSPTLMVILWEGNLPGVDQVFLDGRVHPANWDPSWMGHSIGHWEGDTLVVDTVGFNDRSWVGLFPHTEMLHVVQRYRRPDLGHLEKDVTIEDPGTFIKPWNMHVNWELAPGEEIHELVCENDNYAQHLAK